MEGPDEGPAPVVEGEFQLQIDVRPAHSPVKIVLVSTPEIGGVVPAVVVTTPDEGRDEVLKRAKTVLGRDADVVTTVNEATYDTSDDFSQDLKVSSLVVVSADLSHPRTIPPNIKVRGCFLVGCAGASGDPSAGRQLELTGGRGYCGGGELPHFYATTLGVEVEHPTLPRHRGSK